MLNCIGLALKVANYAGRYTPVVGHAQLTASMIYGRCYALLQLGRKEPTSLAPALGTLAEASRVLSLCTHCPRLPVDHQVQLYLGQILDQILDLLNGINSYVQNLPLGPGSANVPSGLRSSVGKQMKVIDLQTEQILNAIWTSKISSDAPQSTIQFEQMQQLLQSPDEVIRSAQKTLLAERSSRHEFTCEWFSKPFLDFVRGSDSALWVEGRIGCGKSTLYGWILESLQSPVYGREYAVISHTIDPLLPSETNITSVIKDLLRQLVERQYGPGNVGKALANLMTAITTGDAPSQVEQVLWDCLQIAIGDTLQPTMVVIDGMSELDGGETAARTLFQHLLNFAAGNPSVRLLVLSRPFVFSPVNPLRRKSIEGGDLHKDIRRVIAALVPSDSPTPSAEVSRRIDHEADGNFFWSLLAFQEWKAQDFSLQMWRTLPTSLDGIVAMLVSRIDLSDPTTSIVLFSSIIAIRPLRLTELEILSRIDVDNETLRSQTPDVTRAIEQACGSVLLIQDGLVLFRHALLKQGLLDTIQSGVMSLGSEMHADMGLRLSFYIRSVLGQPSELSLNATSFPAIENLFNVHPLLSYALRYWQTHLLASSTNTESASFKSKNEYRSVFPDTIHAAIIEASFWRHKLSYESLRALATAARLRKEILGDHEATLQTIAALAEALRVAKDLTGAVTEFGFAAELAKAILPEFHPFTETCVLRFLEVIDFADGSLIPDSESRKTDALQYLISMYDTQSSPSSEKSIELRYSLAAHYTAVEEYALSAATYQDVHGLIVERYGRDSRSAKVSAKRLITALQYQSEEENRPYSDSIYDDILQAYDVTDPRRISASIAKAEAYTSLGDPFNAELVYINLWYGVAESCHLDKTLENHERLLETGIAYARFLRKEGRVPDAQTVLLGLKSQQTSVVFQSLNIIDLLEEVAVEMKQASLQDMALEILKHVLTWANLEADSGIRKLISEITHGMIYDAESEFSSDAVGRVPTRDASVINALVEKLLKGDRFDDAIAAATPSLNKLWPSVLEPWGSSTLGTWDPELVQLAVSVANAYAGTDDMETAGAIYWHLFQAARQTNAVDGDASILKYANLALTAFSQLGEVERMISLREELLDYSVVKFGEDHSLTIETRYALASLYAREQLFEKTEHQFSRIAETLKRPNFHESSALPALRGLVDIYSRKKAWSRALEVYSWLWDTFLRNNVEHNFDSSTARKLYIDYLKLLKKHDYFKAHELTESYRSACLAQWGERDPATLEASLFLADSWNERWDSCPEAIHLYEWVVDGQDGTPPKQREQSRAFVEAAERKLSDYYQVNGRSISDDGPTTTRAVRLLGKKYQWQKTNEDPSQPATLSSLASWIIMLTEEGSPDSKVVALRELQAAVDLVVESDVPSSTLYNAAVILASSFSANGYVEEGRKTVQRLTEQIVFQDDDANQRARRSNLVFLTAFEAHLTGSVVDFAEIHAKTLMESALWECYKRLNQDSADIATILACGARLRTFVLGRNADDRAAFIERDLFDRFLEYYGAAFAKSTQTVREFFLVLIKELNDERLQLDIPSLACAVLNKNVGGLLLEDHYDSAKDLALPGFEFIRFVGALTNGNKSNLVNGLELGSMVACADVAPLPDHTLASQLLDLSRTILQETLRECRSQDFDFATVDIDLVARIATVLGLQQNYEDLEVSRHRTRDMIPVMKD